MEMAPPSVDTWALLVPAYIMAWTKLVRGALLKEGRWHVESKDAGIHDIYHIKITIGFTSPPFDLRLHSPQKLRRKQVSQAGKACMHKRASWKREREEVFQVWQGRSDPPGFRGSSLTSTLSLRPFWPLVSQWDPMCLSPFVDGRAACLGLPP